MSDEPTRVDKEKWARYIVALDWEPQDEMWAGFHLWCEGPPEWAEDNPAIRISTGHNRELRTVLSWGKPDGIVSCRGENWTLVTYFPLPSETECPRYGTVVQDPEHCELCQADKGELHGHVYVGDGWVEAVYARSER